MAKWGILSEAHAAGWQSLLVTHTSMTLCTGLNYPIPQWLLLASPGSVSRIGTVILSLLQASTMQPKGLVTALLGLGQEKCGPHPERVPSLRGQHVSFLRVWRCVKINLNLEVGTQWPHILRADFQTLSHELPTLKPSSNQYIYKFTHTLWHTHTHTHTHCDTHYEFIVKLILLWKHVPVYEFMSWNEKPLASVPVNL
jgi:hypothetical protein